MEEQEFNLEAYLTRVVENIVKRALKASLSNPKESIFMAKYAISVGKATKLRHEAEERGEHIPPFLIASITSSCNLHCAGCYSRAIDSCSDSAPVRQMSAADWGNVFRESADLGLSFIILAGGEPLMRRDVLLEAAKVPEILFPVITNGTLLRGDYLTLFAQNRNLFPVISIEGNEVTTDLRRGTGMYRLLGQTMENLTGNGILFGASVTATTENLEEVLSGEFVDSLVPKGCKLVIYIEYVPAEENTQHLAPGDAERARMDERLMQLRAEHDDLLFISFPGDENKSSGCLAAGRGFFHINSHGGAEPCPFSPYSDVNVRDIGVKGALHSRLFQALRESGLQAEKHNGGCALFGKDEQVRNLTEGSPAQPNDCQTEQVFVIS